MTSILEKIRDKEWILVCDSSTVRGKLMQISTTDGEYDIFQIKAVLECKMDWKYKIYSIDIMWHLNIYATQYDIAILKELFLTSYVRYMIIYTDHKRYELGDNLDSSEHDMDEFSDTLYTKETQLQNLYILPGTKIVSCIIGCNLQVLDYSQLGLLGG